jgi:uncharacterized membrane protein
LKRLGELAQVTIMEQLLKHLASHIALAVEASAVLVIAAGSLEAFIGLLGVGVGKRATHGARKAVWRRYGVWLLLGLEFELAADIIRSVISPTWLDIGQLGAIAVIRTFLNYFLEKDLESVGRAESTRDQGVADTRRHMA